MTEKKSSQENQIEEQHVIPIETATGEFPDDQKSKKEPSMVVGIGASAGGLEAFTLLLEKLPSDTGMAFVFVQHLDSKHKSALTHIFSRVTSLPECIR